MTVPLTNANFLLAAFWAAAAWHVPPFAGGSATGLSATSAMSMMELSYARIAAHGQKKNW